MKIYTNGCSFTHGHGDGGKAPSRLQRYNNFTYESLDLRVNCLTWAELLEAEPGVSFLFNHAEYATGNHQILRRTLEFLNYLPEDEYENWIFLLQLSQPSRTEFTFNKYNTWVQAHICGRELDIYNKVDRQKLLRLQQVKYDAQVEKDFEESLEDAMFLDTTVYYHNFILNQHHYTYETLIILSHLVYMFEYKKIKYLITGMDEGEFAFAKILKDLYSESMEHIIKQIPTHNIIDSMTKMIPIEETRRYYETCGHLNAIGHRIVADNILNCIKVRGWL